MSTSIVRVDMTAIPVELLKSWASLYCQVWQEPPWNENFWQPDQVVEDFKREMSNPDAEAFLVVREGMVIGFTQGYSVSQAELREIAGNSLLDFLFVGKERVYYVDELAVEASCRGKRLSLQLSRALIDQIGIRGIDYVVLALAARHVYCELGFQELPVHDAKYPSRTYWGLGLDRFVL
jgi:ribosomal protein S18 acetylase RimI-like enzyme